MAHEREKSIAQKANATGCEHQPHEKLTEWVNPFSDQVRVSCIHDTLSCTDNYRWEWGRCFTSHTLAGDNRDAEMPATLTPLRD